MQTRRDQDIYNFVNDFHVATFKQIRRLFFNNTSLRYAQKRMQILHERKIFKRTRSTIDNSNAYYIIKDKKDKPTQIHHDLIRSELFVKLSEHYSILGWSNETPIVNIRPDALAYIKSNKHSSYIEYNSNTIPIFIEIHLNNKFNFQKYIDLQKSNNLKDLFGNIPMVLICTDRKNVEIPSNISLKFKIIDINMNGLEYILK